MGGNQDNSPGVSIRSPYRSKGRPQLGDGITALTEFQSAPLTEARGDTAAEAK